MTTTPEKPAPVREGAATYGGAISKPKAIAIVAVLWALAMLVQNTLDPHRHYYTTAETATATAANGKPISRFRQSLGNNLFGASFFGMREVIAGMLWVKADELFHEGKYQELVPYFSLVTFMDPHQIDVYSTGAWHLMYNFQDARMVPQGMAFLDDGIRNNATVWDLYFQKGWTNFDWPVENYDAALPYFVEAAKHPSTDGTPHPPYIDHMIAHAFTRQGEIDSAIAKWQQNLDFAQSQMVVEEKTNDVGQLRYWQQERDVCRNNRDILITRAAARRDLPQHPIPLSIKVSVKKVDSRIVDVTSRIIGLPRFIDTAGDVTNARVEVVLQDKNYDQLVASHLNDLPWIGQHLTRYRSIYDIVEQNGVVTLQGKPWVRIDMTKDPAGLDPPRLASDLFPLESDQYELIVRLDPRVRREPEQIQDKLGWKGEGIAPGPDVVNGTHGARVLEHRITLTRDQII